MDLKTTILLVVEDKPQKLRSCLGMNVTQAKAIHGRGRNVA
jgi:hypothetical protein